MAVIDERGSEKHSSIDENHQFCHGHFRYSTNNKDSSLSVLHPEIASQWPHSVNPLNGENDRTTQIKLKRIFCQKTGSAYPSPFEEISQHGSEEHAEECHPSLSHYCKPAAIPCNAHRMCFESPNSCSDRSTPPTGDAAAPRIRLAKPSTEYGNRTKRFHLPYPLYCTPGRTVTGVIHTPHWKHCFLRPATVGTEPLSISPLTTRSYRRDCLSTQSKCTWCIGLRSHQTGRLNGNPSWSSSGRTYVSKQTNRRPFGVYVIVSKNLPA